MLLWFAQHPPTPSPPRVYIYIYKIYFATSQFENSSTVNGVYKENNQMTTGSIVLSIVLPKPIAKNVECSLTKY